MRCGACCVSLPRDGGEFVLASEDRAIFQASPDELPVIAINVL